MITVNIEVRLRHRTLKNPRQEYIYSKEDLIIAIPLVIMPLIVMYTAQPSGNFIIVEFKKVLHQSVRRISCRGHPQGHSSSVLTSRLSKVLVNSVNKAIVDNIEKRVRQSTPGSPLRLHILFKEDVIFAIINFKIPRFVMNSQKSHLNGYISSV